MTSASTSSETAVATAATNLFAELPQRELPAPAETWLLHGRAPGEGRAVVVMRQTALLQVSAHSRSNLNVELGGALLGRAYRHGEGVVIEVQAALPAISQDHGPVHFTFSADSWSRLHQDRAAHYPDLDIIGWFHTHPDLGVFYSSDDVVVHSAAFTQPWHVGLVVDPVREEAAYFGWVAGALTPLDGFYELPDRQPEPIVPWRIVPTAVWEQPYAPPTATSPELGESHVFLPHRGGGFAVSAREIGLGIAALFGIGALLLLAAVLLPMWQRANLLEDAVLALSNQPALVLSTCPDPNLRIITPLNGATVAGDVPVLGTAEIEGAARYQLDMRPNGAETWSLVDRQNSDEALGTLGTWDTTALPDGPYELRLSAVDRNNIRLSTSTPCTIGVTVVTR